MKIYKMFPELFSKLIQTDPPAEAKVQNQLK